MDIHIQTFPLCGDTYTIYQVGYGSSPHSHLILVVDDTIAIDILILDVARHIIAKSLFGAITDVIVILEQAQCNKSLSLVDTVATLHPIRINVLLFIFFLHFVL